MTTSNNTATFAKVFLVLQFGVTVTLCQNINCQVDLLKDYGLKAPIFLDKSGASVIYPVATSPEHLTFAPGVDQTLHCLGGKLTRSSSKLNVQSVQSSCFSNRTFVTKDAEKYALKDLSCTDAPTPKTREIPTGCGTEGEVLIELGYDLTSVPFWPVLELCHSKALATTHWAHVTIRSILGLRSWRDEPKSPTFSKNKYFTDIFITRVYPRKKQNVTFHGMFDNDSKSVEKYLKPTSKEGDQTRNNLVKGHLVARADLYYAAEKLSTYMYINALPMWESINNGNWKSVETQIRRLAKVHGNLDVYVGGIGILSLEDKPVYLGQDKKDKNRLLLPVPRILFKVIVTQDGKNALVFLTANNPYLDAGVTKEYKLCNEYAECHAKFGNWKNIFEGYTYCCKFDDFMANDEIKKIALPLKIKNPSPVKL